MSEQQVVSQDEKQAPETVSEKQTVNQVPYARFSELVDEKNVLKSELSEIRKSLSNDKESRRIKELEAKGEYDQALNDVTKKLVLAQEKADAFDQYQASRREALLSKLPEDDREIYADMRLEKLEVHVDRFANRPTSKVQVGKPGRESTGGYESLKEFALKDPQGYKKMKAEKQKTSIWGDIFEG
jgi:hypothetical protein